MKASFEFKLSKDNWIGIMEMGGYGVTWASRMSFGHDHCCITMDDEDAKLAGKGYYLTVADVEKAALDIFLYNQKLNDYHVSAIRTLVVQGCGSDIGSDIADVIIQQACFGEILFG